MPVIRVSDCRASGATRNEDWPDSPTVKQTRVRRKRVMKNTTLCAIIGTAVVLVLVLIFNPGIEAHREALGVPFDRTWWNEDKAKCNWFARFGLWLGGDDVRLWVRSRFLDSLTRENYAIFSLGYVNGKLVTLGVLGFVHVFKSDARKAYLRLSF